MGSRLFPLSPAELDQDQRALYDAITGGPRASGPRLFPLVDEAGHLQGPFDAMLRSPAVGTALQAVGAAVRYRTVLTPRIRELAILAVAAWWGSGYERYAHEAVGRSCGLTEDEMSAVAAGDTPPLDDPDERVVLFAVHALLSTGDLDDETYAEVVARMGERGIFELTTLVGYYSTLALQLQVFRVSSPNG